MGKEIERKFLVKDMSFKNMANGILCRQGYLGTKPTVRVRIIGDSAYLTIKGAAMGISRDEYEYQIPLRDADEMLSNLCRKPIIEKYRYIIDYEGFTWEIDEFLGENEGLVVAEIELNDDNQEFIKPDFIGIEVTHDSKYRNSNLVWNPYKNW